MSYTCQERYWKELDQLRVHVFYVVEYIEHTVHIDRSINIFLALCSNGSIAGWAIWQKYSFFWGVIIALSQIVNALKGYLPYVTRLRSLYNLSSELEALFIDAENKWYDVAQGKMTEEDVHRSHMNLKQREVSIVQNSFKKNALPHKERYMENARKLASEYFKNFYGE